MIKRISAGLFICMLVTAAAAFAQQNKKPLSLEDCIVGALKNNLRIAVEVLNPEISDMSVTRANEKYLPSLSFGYSNRETNTASYSWIDAADQVRVSYNDQAVYFNQLIPTGGTLNFSLSSYKNETNRSFQTINPRYGSTLTFNFIQPLLRNFGFRINRREIIIAKNNREISENEFQPPHFRRRGAERDHPLRYSCLGEENHTYRRGLGHSSGQPPRPQSHDDKPGNPGVQRELCQKSTSSLSKSAGFLLESRHFRNPNTVS